VNTKVILSGGVQAKNVIWQNAGNVKIQAGAFMRGIILCFTDVAIETGASVNGVIMAPAVALQKATVTATGMCDGSSHEPVIALAGIDLKSACGYAVLSKWHLHRSQLNIVGNIGVSPITAAAMTGFSLDVGGQFALSAQVTDMPTGRHMVVLLRLPNGSCPRCKERTRMPQTASTWMYRG
jgi:hypothetical protein